MSEFRSSSLATWNRQSALRGAFLRSLHVRIHGDEQLLAREAGATVANRSLLKSLKPAWGPRMPKSLIFAGLELVAVVHGLSTFGADLELVELLQKQRKNGSI